MLYVIVGDKMDKLIIKIGGDMKKDLKKVYENPKKYGSPGSTVVYLENGKDLSEVLSPKKLELLRCIIDCQTERKTIGELAQELGRKQEAISRDASFLAAHQVLKKVKRKREVYLEAPFKSIEIMFETLETQSTST